MVKGWFLVKSTNGFFWFASAILMLGALQLIASIELSEAAWVGEAIYIKADGSVEPEGSPIATDDYVIYRLTSNVAADNGIIVQRDNIVIDGCGCAIQGVGPQDSKGVGVNATGRSGVVIKNVEISGFRYGICLKDSSGIVLINNSINNNINGIALWSSHNNTITKNTISSSESLNIYLWLSSGNIVVENSVARGRCGIWLDESSDNAFYHNNIADNAMQVYFTPGSLNSWDGGYPSGGNFWSNHRSIDEKSGSAQDKPGGDGIGDSPYPLDEVNVDRFPLMNPWPNRAVKVESSTGAGAVVFRSSPGLIVGLRAVPEESLPSVGELGAEFS
ncbi:MAG: NosD domain-containing protein, partial [Desulfurococcaceae archaeon]